MDIEELIKKTVEATNTAMMKELKRHKMLKNIRQSPFQKTETLLYNYSKFENILKSKLEDIETIETEGISKRSTSFVKWSSSNNYDGSNDYTRSLNAIEKIKSSIIQVEGYIHQIDNALNTIKDDPYYELIPMWYFEGQTREEIAEYFYADVSTISRNKTRLINLLQIRLFSDEYLEDILG